MHLEVPKQSNQDNENSQSSSILSYSAYYSKPNKETKQKDLKTLLSGLKFAVTGEFDSVSRDRIQEIVADMGGRVVTGVSG